MTTPEERTRAVIQTQEFLLDLATRRSRTPDVPDYVREEAYRLLRHYPDPFHLYYAAHMRSAFFGVPEGYEELSAPLDTDHPIGPDSPPEGNTVKQSSDTPPIQQKKAYRNWVSRFLNDAEWAQNVMVGIGALGLALGLAAVFWETYLRR